MLMQMHSHAAPLQPGGEARAALAAGGTKARELVELPAEAKDGLLQWAQAHCVLLQVFGPREQLQRLQAAPGNAYHFDKLARYAAVVAELGLDDEAYFVPLRDVHAFSKQLHADAGLSKAAREGLMVYGMNAKRRSARKSVG